MRVISKSSIAFIFLVGTGGMAAAQAEVERERSGPLGESSATKVISKTDDGRSISVSGTGPNGTTYDRNTDVVRDADTGVRTRSSSGSNSLGGVSSGTRTGSCSGGSCEASGEFTGSKGGVTTFGRSSERLGAGNWRSERNWTGARGKSGMVQRRWQRVK
ncbi:MAG: hypothetical protein AAGA97_05935 [Pseudomonadota bacterium]